MRTPEFAPARHDGLPEVIERWCVRAAAVVPVGPETFAVPRPDVLQTSLADTLQAHYAAIIEGVAFAEWIGTRCGDADVSAGYSMGLYAALAYSGALTFEDTLRVVTHVCEEAHAQAQHGPWAVGAVVGLAPDLVQVLADEHGVEVTDRYGATTWLVTGQRDAVVLNLNTALARGAASTRLLPLTAPFHGSPLRPLEHELTKMLVDVPVAAPRVPVLSTTTLQLLTTADDVRAELPRNVARPMNWYGTIEGLVTRGARRLIECGASTSLTDEVREDFSTRAVGEDFRAFESGPR